VRFEQPAEELKHVAERGQCHPRGLAFEVLAVGGIAVAVRFVRRGKLCRGSRFSPQIRSSKFPTPG
jgi:hypothetical protein